MLEPDLVAKQLTLLRIMLSQESPSARRLLVLRDGVLPPHTQNRAADCAIPIAADRGSSPSDLASRLAAKLPADDLAAVLVFVSAHYDASAFAEAMALHYPQTPVYGCTSAGELAPSGLEENSAVALGFRKADFTVAAKPIFNLSAFQAADGFKLASELRQDLSLARDLSEAQAHPGDHVFGILLVDGLSQCEETLISSISNALDDVPIVGGSAADQLRFEKTSVICGGAAHQDAAVLLLVSTALPFVAFKCDHLQPTSNKLVITEADPIHRSVREINAEAATKEYADSIGLAEKDLDADAFALHPMVIQIGLDHYARSIRKADPDGTLHFFSAIDQGLVLTSAVRGDALSSLNDLFEKTEAEIGEVSLYLGFDCVLRRIDAERHQKARDLSELYRDHHVIGFNTYGEQFQSMHLNETFTGIAIGRRRLTA